MGFSDTATYIRNSKGSSIRDALKCILKRYEFHFDASENFPFVASYQPLEETPGLTFWTRAASKEFTRLYCTHSGIFAVHSGDHVPLLQTLAKELNTHAFEIAIDDGDSMCVLETDGKQSRLTGAHSYVLDELYELSGKPVLTPGTVLTLRGIQFPYQSLEVNPTLVPELVKYDFDVSVIADAISDFERTTFGKTLPTYYDFDDTPNNGPKVFSYRRQA